MASPAVNVRAGSVQSTYQLQPTPRTGAHPGLTHLLRARKVSPQSLHGLPLGIEKRRGRAPLCDPARRLHIVGSKRLQFEVAIMKPTILVPFDFGPPAHAALRWAAELQKSTGAGPLHVIHAVSALTVVPSDLPVGTLLPTEDEMKEFEKKMSDAARNLGATAVARVVVR